MKKFPDAIGQSQCALKRPVDDVKQYVVGGRDASALSLGAVTAGSGSLAVGECGLVADNHPLHRKAVCWIWRLPATTPRRWDRAVRLSRVLPAD